MHYTSKLPQKPGIYGTRVVYLENDITIDYLVKIEIEDNELYAYTLFDKDNFGKDKLEYLISNNTIKRYWTNVDIETHLTNISIKEDEK